MWSIWVEWRMDPKQWEQLIQAAAAATLTVSFRALHFFVREQSVAICGRLSARAFFPMIDSGPLWNKFSLSSVIIIFDCAAKRAQPSRKISCNMEGLNGNVFFNVTLSFWTTPNRTRVSPSGNGGPASVSGQTSQTASHSHSVHTNPITATLNLTQTKDALKQNLSSLWRKETTDSGGSGGQPSVVNTVVSSHSGGSPIDRKQNVNLTNSLMNGNISRPNIWDTLVSDNQTQTNYSYLGALGSARVKGRFAHYSDSSIGHPVLESSRVPIVGAASNDDDYQLFDYDNVSTGSWMSSPSWNLTLTSEPSTTTTTANWTDVFYLNNQSLWKDCFDSNLLHDGCVRTVNESANLTTTGGYEQLLDEHERVYWALFLIILPILALFGNILVILR